MLSPIKVRTAASAILIICAAVVLGISAHIEHSVRVVGYHSSAFTFAAFVGAFTLVFEIASLFTRWAAQPNKLNALPVEAAYALLLWIFWLASAISTTTFTETDRSVCKHLDDLFDLPEFSSLDPDLLAALRSVMKDTCRTLHAELAFLWIGFVVTTFVFGYTTVCILRTRARGGKSIRETTYRNYNAVLHTHEDPFQDPVGAAPGPSIGVPSTRA